VRYHWYEADDLVDRPHVYNQKWSVNLVGYSVVVLITDRLRDDVLPPHITRW